MNALVLLSLLSLPARAGDFIDTWVTLAYEDTNVRAGSVDESPGPNFVERGNQIFFENYESRYTDDITQSHLVLYKKTDAFWKDWYTEAAFVLQFSPYLNVDESDEGVDLEDDGSYVRLVKKIEGADDNTFSVTGYAIDASRFRLGYSYDLTWGGKEIFIRNPQAAPGLRFQWDRKGSYLYAGAKTAIQNMSIEDQSGGEAYTAAVNQVYYGLMAGGGLQLAEKLRIEAGIGQFRQGQMDNLNTDEDNYGKDINAIGFSGQVAWRSTTELEFIRSADLSVYRNSPDFIKESYIAHTQVDGTGLLVQAEANYLLHDLADPQTYGIVIEPAMSADLQLLLAHGTTEVGFDVVYKDLSYILFNVPGITSCFAIGDIENTPQLYGRFKAGHYFPKARITPSVGVGLMQPATYTTDAGVMVVQSDTEQERVPDGQEAKNILGAVAGLQVDASQAVVLQGELLYARNPNLSEYVCEQGTDVNCVGTRIPAEDALQNALGFNIMMRARF